MLIYHAGYHGLGRRLARQRADEVLELFRLDHKADARAYELSGGMQRRLVLARALVHRPRLLILDEPTAGVDVELRSEIWRLVKGLNAAGTTILLTTHYLEEAETLCDEIALLRAGRIVDRGFVGLVAGPVRGARHRRAVPPGDHRLGRTVSVLEGYAPPPYDQPFRARAAGVLWLLEREVRRFANIWRYSVRRPGAVDGAVRHRVRHGPGPARRPHRRRVVRAVHRARTAGPGHAQRRVLQRHHQPVRGPPRPLHPRRVRQPAAVVGDQRRPGRRR